MSEHDNNHDTGEFRGYGLCPRCHVADHMDTSRERRPNGDTWCGACGQPSLSANWKEDGKA